MIKNNFKILIEERDHILNLVRLPNHRKPISLLEQVWPAEHLPLDPDAENRGSSDQDIKIIFQNMQLFGDPSEIYTKKLTAINNQIIDRIENGFRSSVFSQFSSLLDSLISSKPQYKSYYQGEKERFESAVNKATTGWSNKLGIEHNPLSNPLRDQLDVYEEEAVNSGYFPAYFKNVYAFMPTKGDITKESQALDCKQCIDATRNYVNSILNDSLNAYVLDDYKNKLKACWNKFENPNEKNIFGRYRRGKQCDDKNEARRVYNKFIVPLLKSTTDPKKSQIDGKIIEDKYKLDITER